MTSRPFSHLWSSRRTRFNHMINRFEANSSTNHGILIFDHILMINYNFQDLVCCDNLTRVNICCYECEADLSDSKMNLKLINPWSWERPLGFSPDRFCSHCEKTLFDWAPPCCSLLLTVRGATILLGIYKGKRRMEGGIWQWAIWWFSPLGLPSLPTTSTSLHCNRGTPICQKSSTINWFSLGST